MLFGFLAGFAYFEQAKPNTPLYLRLLTAAYCPAVDLIFWFSVWISQNHRYQHFWIKVFFSMQYVLPILLAVSIFGYPGPKRLHFLLVPLMLLLWACTFFMSYFSVVGE
ncbi:MAG: hypothetical protein HYZ45_02240 [Burkholderiales bacterium]|nr:hypothetical protein [Burkholderiales bacterium]